MSVSVGTCGRNTNLAEAAMTMWHNDCGVVPVTDPDGKAVGMITDRDICMATATRSLKAADITVGEVMTGEVFTCRPEEDVLKALKTMAHQKVRRLAVVDREGRLAGILSINDLVGHVGRGLPATAIVDTLRSICEHRNLRREKEAQEDKDEDFWVSP
jgi:CBS domain-containing protein